MLGGESQADGMFSALSLEEGVSSVEPVAPEGRGIWRCLAVERLSHVQLRTGAWYTEPRANRQTCIDEVDFDIDAQPEDDPQNGQ
jgi:hypothetical protein